MGFLKGRLAFAPYKLVGGSLAGFNSVASVLNEKYRWQALGPKQTHGRSVVMATAVVDEEKGAGWADCGWGGAWLLDMVDQRRVPKAAIVARAYRQELRRETQVQRALSIGWKPNPEFCADLRARVAEEEALKVQPTEHRWPVCIMHESQTLLLGSRSPVAIGMLQELLDAGVAVSGAGSVTLDHQFLSTWAAGNDLPFGLAEGLSYVPHNACDHLAHWLSTLTVEAIGGRGGLALGDWIKVRFADGRCRQATLRANIGKEQNDQQAAANPIAAFAASGLRGGAVVDEVALWVAIKDGPKIRLRVDRTGFLSEIDCGMKGSERTESPDICMDYALRAKDMLMQHAAAFGKARGDSVKWSKGIAKLRDILASFAIPNFPKDLEVTSVKAED